MSFKRFQDLLAVCFSVFFAGASGLGLGFSEKGLGLRRYLGVWGFRVGGLEVQGFGV